MVFIHFLGHAKGDIGEADRNIAMVAVTQNGRALKYAAEVIKAGREIVFAALSEAQDQELLKQFDLYAFIPMDLWGDQNITHRLIDIYRVDLHLRFIFCCLRNARISLFEL